MLFDYKDELKNRSLYFSLLFCLVGRRLETGTVIFKGNSTELSHIESHHIISCLKSRPKVGPTVLQLRDSQPPTFEAMASTSQQKLSEEAGELSNCEVFKSSIHSLTLTKLVVFNFISFLFSSF